MESDSTPAGSMAVCSDAPSFCDMPDSGVTSGCRMHGTSDRAVLVTSSKGGMSVADGRAASTLRAVSTPMYVRRTVCVW